jgi:hypothetical protein
LTFTEDDSYYFTNWQKHTGRFEEYLAEFPQVLAASRERVPEDTLQRWVMSVGACYYVGATMAGAIEEALGRECLVKSLVDIGSFFSAYDAAASAKGLPRLDDEVIRAYCC